MPLKIIRQDIIKMNVDAIVNSTNSGMIGYSGVDYAVHEAAGPKLDEACRKIAPIGLGEAKITKGYNLSARYIIHTHGPVWNGEDSDDTEILKSCYLNSLRLAEEKRLGSVAFPLISSGNNGFPKDKVLEFALSTISGFLLEHEMMVYICVYDRTSYEFSKALAEEITEFISDAYVGKNENDISSDLCAFEDVTAEDVSVNCSRPSVGRKFAKKRNCFETLAFAAAPQEEASVAPSSLEKYILSMDASFSQKLFAMIDASGMSEVECYKKANVDRKTFSKIRKDSMSNHGRIKSKPYQPKKSTAVAFAIALRLNLSQTQELLASAGMTLSDSFVFDKIIMFYILREEYDINKINEALYEFDQEQLGVSE